MVRIQGVPGSRDENFRCYLALSFLVTLDDTADGSQEIQKRSHPLKGGRSFAINELLLIGTLSRTSCLQRAVINSTLKVCSSSITLRTTGRYAGSGQCGHSGQRVTK